MLKVTSKILFESCLFESWFIESMSWSLKYLPRIRNRFQRQKKITPVKLLGSKTKTFPPSSHRVKFFAHRKNKVKTLWRCDFSLRNFLSNFSDGRRRKKRNRGGKKLYSRIASRAIFHMIGFKFSTSLPPCSPAPSKHLPNRVVCALNVFKVLSKERHIIISWLLDFSLSEIGFLYILYDVASMWGG